MSQKSKKQSSLILGILTIGAGAYIMLVAANVIHADESSFHAPRWIVGLSGLVFLSGGAAVSLQDAHFDPLRKEWWFREIVNLAGPVMILLFAIITNWIAFAPGERSFGGGISLPFISISNGDLNQLSGRVVFGASAICLNILVVVLLGRGLRALLLGRITDQEPED